MKRYITQFDRALSARWWMQLERSLVPGDVANDEFSDEISAQHAGMTPLALACALNKLPSVKVWRRTQICLLEYVHGVAETAHTRRSSWNSGRDAGSDPEGLVAGERRGGMWGGVPFLPGKGSAEAPIPKR